MKKVFTLFVALIIVSAAFAQKKNVQSAYSYLNKGKLDKAVSYIIPALVNPASKDLAKTWKYAGDIYLRIGQSNNEEYRALDPDPLQKAYEAYIKCMELDHKNNYKLDVLNDLTVVAQEIYAVGVMHYEAQDFAVATEDFMKVVKVKSELGVVDTAAYFNAGLCALQSDNPDKALEVFGDMKKAGIENPDVFNNIAKIYADKGDTVQAGQYIIEGIEKFPKDANLRISSINVIDIPTKNWDNAIANINVCIEFLPNNMSLYDVKANVYYQKGNFEESKKVYADILEMTTEPQYVISANMQLANLYIDDSNVLNNEANAIPFEEDPSGDKFNAKIAERDVLLMQALPYLETAYNMDPSDVAVAQSLKQIYTRLKMKEKADTIK